MPAARGNGPKVTFLKIFKVTNRPIGRIRGSDRKYTDDAKDGNVVWMSVLQKPRC
jgi:hypothetical protein